MSKINRTRPTQAQQERLDAQIIEVLTEDHPQSCRHVFYRMTDPRLPEPVEKSMAGYRRILYRLKAMRRDGRIPYGWISDASRRGYHVSTYRNAADFIESMIGLYRANLWNDTNYYCEVWVESRSLAGVIQDDCEKLAISLYPAGGFSSISFAFQAAESINAEHNGRKVVIFYIGDYDPSGVLIDVSIENELAVHLDADVDWRFERIGITPEQIIEHDLPSKPRTDATSRVAYLTDTVEAEAMPAATMRKLLRKHVEALLPKRALKAALAAEESERMMLYGIAGVAALAPPAANDDERLVWIDDLTAYASETLGE